MQINKKIYFYGITIEFLEFNQLTSSKLMKYFAMYEFLKRNATLFLVGGSIGKTTQGKNINCHSRKYFPKLLLCTLVALLTDASRRYEA